MWALINNDNTIKEIIRIPKAMEIDGIKQIQLIVLINLRKKLLLLILPPIKH